MDYSNFYRIWLQIEITPEKEPNFYEILGLSNMEPDTQKIRVAINESLDKIQNVNGGENPDAYSHVLQLLLTARRVLLDNPLKYDYDSRLSSVTGEPVVRNYVRPTLLERLRQWGLIGTSLILGGIVMMVMAITVQRNPDGSIMFHEDVKQKKVRPFVAQLDYVVYRPSMASDFLEEGYVAATSEESEKKEELVTKNGSSARTVASSSTGETMEQDDFADLLPEEAAEVPSASALSPKAESTENELSDFANILAEEEKPVPAGEPSNSSASGRRANPLYSHTEQMESTTSEAGKTDLNPEPLTSKAQVKETLSVPSAQEEKKTEVVFPLTSVKELLENVGKNINPDLPGASEAFVLLQFQTCNETLTKLKDAEGAFEQTEMKDFVEYSLELVMNLGREKHFDEAYQLCATLESFAKKYEISDEFLTVLDSRPAAVPNDQEMFNRSLEIKKELLEKPDDPVLNTNYAMWLWFETGEIQNSIPYLAKCQYGVIRRAANFELQLGKDKRLETPQAMMQLADYWWTVAERLKDENQIVMVKNHAKSFYAKVDSNLLNDQQKERISNY